MSFFDRNGITRRRIFHDDHKRKYLLYIPANYSDQIEAPIVLNFHGFGSTALDQLRLSDWRELADKNNFILIYPQGLKLTADGKTSVGATHWNPDPLSGDNKSESKDLGFVMKLLRRISKQYSTDLSRVYATGFSNGADMAYGLASYGSNIIAGIAPVSGLMSEKNLSMSLGNEVGVISFNGTNDWIRPLGGFEGYLASTVETSNYWAQVNNSSQTRYEQFSQESGNLIERTTYLNADGIATVQQYIINGGGHEWFDLNIEGSNLNQLAWSFFSTLVEEDVQSIESARGKGKLKGTNVADAFTFNSFELFSKKNADKIIGFDASEGDTIAVSAIAFPGLEDVSDISFATTKSKKELKQLSKDDYDFVYFEKKGRLYFDGNGSVKNWGNSDEGGLVAILKGNPELSDEDFTLLV